MLARTRLAPVRTRRRGAAIVESALVLAVFLMLLFGLFEYCRFLMVLHVTGNAARDGARYGAVNITKPTNFDTVDYTDASGKVYPSVTRYTTERYGGTQKNVTGFAVKVYPCDVNGAAVPGSPPWNASPFPGRVAVQITGTYRPVIPLSINTGRFTLAIIPDNIPVNITAIMGSEG